MKILAIVGSPRKLGNCELILKEISRNISRPHQLQLLRLADFQIHPCRGCYRCLQKGRCVLEDDFETAARVLVEADVLMVAAPTYFLGPNSSLKRFLDRGISLYSRAEKMWGKPAVGVGIAGIEGKEGYTRLGIESFLKFSYAAVKEVRILYAALPGEIFLDEGNKAVAKELAAALFEPQKTSEGPCCNLCGGTSFRFQDARTLTCLLCSNTGNVTLVNGQLECHIHEGEHNLFLTLEDALEHGKWLQNMKRNFREHFRQLKKISEEYANDGTWIEPKR